MDCAVLLYRTSFRLGFPHVHGSLQNMLIKENTFHSMILFNSQVRAIIHHAPKFKDREKEENGRSGRLNKNENRGCDSGKYMIKIRSESERDKRDRDRERYSYRKKDMNCKNES